MRGAFAWGLVVLSVTACGGPGAESDEFARLSFALDEVPEDDLDFIPTDGNYCGDGVAENEPCDGTDLNGRTCQSYGFVGGTLLCDTNCNLDFSGCSYSPVCGDSVISYGEDCEGNDLEGQTCFKQGFLGGGALACDPNTCLFDPSGCVSTPLCGDGIIAYNERCDGTNLLGHTCLDFGFGGGTLLCTECAIDTSECVP